MTLDHDGDILRICADQPVEFYVVDPRCSSDRVYLCGHVEFGPQFVQEEIGGYPIGHFYDEERGKLPLDLPPGRAFEAIFHPK